MTRIEETISTKIGSIWHTGAAKRGGTIYIVDKDYNKEEAEEAIQTAKKTLREAGFAANVGYYWCHTGDRPLRVYIRTTKKQEEANAKLDHTEVPTTTAKTYHTNGNRITYQPESDLWRVESETGAWAGFELWDTLEEARRAARRSPKSTKR